jgi:hypothetical protein
VGEADLKESHKTNDLLECAGISDALKRKGYFAQSPHHDDSTPTRDDLKVQLFSFYLVLAIFAVAVLAWFR